MSYYLIKPEVSGGWGPLTEADRSTMPPRVTSLHYEFDDWLGSAIIASSPCYAITEAAREHIETAQLTGAVFDEMIITTSQLFDDVNPDGLALPTFYWLKIDGAPAVDDFGIAPRNNLVISERALVIFQELGLSDSIVKPWPDLANADDK